MDPDGARARVAVGDGGWQPNSGDPNWQTHRCRGCPHLRALLPHQQWLPLRKQAESASRPSPWNLPEYVARHPGLGAGERALAWLREQFGRRSF